MIVRVSRSRAVAALLAVSVILASAGALVVTISDRENRPLLMRAFDLDLEGNVPTIFSGMVLLIDCVLLTLVAVESRRTQKLAAWGWFLLAALFATMSIDEVADLHNRAGAFVPRAVQAISFLRFRWVVPGLAFAALTFATLIPFLTRLSPGTRTRMLACGALYLSGALGMEMAGAWSRSPASGFRGVNLYEYLVVIEEALEMTGAILFVAVLLRYIEEELGGAARARSFEVRVNSAQSRR
jgi:hypothetical protein